MFWTALEILLIGDYSAGVVRFGAVLEAAAPKSLKSAAIVVGLFWPPYLGFGTVMAVFLTKATPSKPWDHDK